MNDDTDDNPLRYAGLGLDELRPIWMRADQWCILVLEAILVGLGAVVLIQHDPPVWMAWTCSGMAPIIALWGWWRALTRARTIDGTPVSRIASTAQGYARLAGRGRLLDGRQRVFEPGTGVACLWLRANSEESDASFLLDDGSGAVCAVDPEGAEMQVHRHRIEYFEDGTFVEYWYLLPGDPIYVQGEFVTVGSIDPDLDTHRQIGELLELWKADRPGLLRRFDLDGNGEIDPQEWELARAAARREVRRMQQAALTAPQAHVMCKPRDGRPYIISDRDPAATARLFRRWAIVHGAIFIAAACALVWFYISMHATGSTI